MDTFFKKIVYSSCNEDSNSEREALDIQEDDVVLCITASGARPLDLLIDNPQKIISIDFNATQNYLLELKVACYKNISYDDFCVFIGLVGGTSKKRNDIYSEILRNELSFEAKNFWDKNIYLIQKGILYIGTWDKILTLFSNILYIRKPLIHKMFLTKDIKEQSQIWNTRWDNFFWRGVLRISSSRFIWKYIFREPGVQFVPGDFDIYNYMKGKLDILGNNRLLAKSHIASLMFLGKYNTRYNIPLHLQEKYYKDIGKRVQNIEIRTISLYDFCKDNVSMRDVSALSLSDFGSYCSDKDYKEIWSSLSQNVKKGTKFCERQFLIKRDPDVRIKNIKRDTLLEKKLEEKDSTVFYSFVSGIIS